MLGVISVGDRFKDFDSESEGLVTELSTSVGDWEYARHAQDGSCSSEGEGRDLGTN